MNQNLFPAELDLCLLFMSIFVVKGFGLVPCLALVNQIFRKGFFWNSIRMWQVEPSFFILFPALLMKLYSKKDFHFLKRLYSCDVAIPFSGFQF